MLNLQLDVARVDYRGCVEVLLPQLVEHCAAKSAPNETDRFLAGLGAEAVPAACALLEEMSADDKDRMVVWLVSAHEERMRDSANRHLAELFGASIVRVGRFAALDRPGSRLAQLAEQVDADYSALLRSPLVNDGIERIGSEYAILKSAAKLAVQMGTHLSGESLEKQALLLLNSTRVRQRLVDALQGAVRQAGLDVELENVTVERSTAVLLPQGGTAPIPGSFEERMMRRLAERAAALRNGR
ncbi:MAG: hypothetical protein IKN81_00290 [Oscillospiraceae bacterium]|nr:hypothetical protein [Oscillospiraceae bacterium]